MLMITQSFFFNMIEGNQILYVNWSLLLEVWNNHNEQFRLLCGLANGFFSLFDYEKLLLWQRKPVGSFQMPKIFNPFWCPTASLGQPNYGHSWSISTSNGATHWQTYEKISCWPQVRINLALLAFLQCQCTCSSVIHD